MSGEKSMRIHREHRAVFQLLCASQCFPLAVAGLAGTNWTWAENRECCERNAKTAEELIETIRTGEQVLPA